ncbi:Uncharacterised protein g8890 [Pycnogonum litorale]
MEENQETSTGLSPEASESEPVTNSIDTDKQGHRRLPSTRCYDVNSDTGSHFNRREEIARKTEELMEKLNLKRRNDEALLDGIKKSLTEVIQRTISSLVEYHYTIDVLNNADAQTKLDKLSSTLDRIAQLENEYEDFRRQLNEVYVELNQK